MTVKPVHSLYGVPAAGQQYVLGAGEGTKVAPFSGIEYIGNVRCSFEGGGACTAPRAKGTDFCVGHLRRIAKNEGLTLDEVVARGGQ
jgi:hypothetical protein